MPLDSRAIIEPTTLQMPSVFAPLARDSRMAAIVSAVSPDCVIRMVRSLATGQRIAIAEFAGVVDLDRQLGEALDHELAGQSGVPTGAAGGDVDLA